jgi:hypothetical protein
MNQTQNICELGPSVHGEVVGSRYVPHANISFPNTHNAGGPVQTTFTVAAIPPSFLGVHQARLLGGGLILTPKPPSSFRFPCTGHQTPTSSESVLFSKVYIR